MIRVEAMPSRTDAPHVLADLAKAENIPDPHPYLDGIREHHPVHQAPGGYYLVARHADNMRVYSAEFRRPHPHEMAELWPQSAQYETPKMLSGVVSMLNPPEHTRLRRFFSQAFNPRQVNRMRSAVADTCGQLLDAMEEPLRDGETVDLHTAVSMILPTRTVAAAMNIGESERARLYGLMPAVNAGFAPLAPEETMRAADRATNEITDFFTDLCEERGKQPGDDLVSAWVQARDDEGVLSHRQLMSIVWGLVSGGTSTTMSGLSSGMLMMAEHPDTTVWLRGDDPADAKAFAAEVVRHESPSVVGALPYYAVHEVELSGVVLPAGTRAHAMPAAANRDPAVFPDPARFDPARDTGKSLGFGHGVHYCLGMHLATMQMTTMFPMLHRRFPGLVLADAPVWGNWLPIRSLSSLPVRLDPA
jgi:cytochrome P450